jgi:hypothetical protein
MTILDGASHVRPADLLLSEPRPLLVRRQLATRVGLMEAVALQQLHWLLDHYDSRSFESDGRRWLSADLKFWCEQFPWSSESTIRRTFSNLMTNGLVAKARGRDSNAWTINYEAVDQLASAGQSEQSDLSHRAVETGQPEQSPSIGEVGEEVEEEQHGADGSAQLFETPDERPPAPDASDEDEKIADVWAHYVETFGERLRVKELTPPRERTIRKALRAISGDVALAKRAIDGLKSYRASSASQSTDVSISVIFETGPHSKSNLADQIEWWAGQSQSSLPSVEEDRSNIPIDLSTVPSVTKGRIEAERRHVTRMFAHPDDEAAQDRGRKALDWLRESVGHEPKVENGELHGWRQVTP